MILKNYWAWQRSFSMISGMYDVSLSLDQSLFKTDGTEISTLKTASNYNPQFLNLLNLSVVVGTGTTTPNTDDYSLETDESSLITSQSYIISSTPSGLFIIFSGTLSNTTSSDISINEIGVRKSFAGTNQSGYMLLSREVLTTPLTIPANSSAPFTYTWKQQ